MPGMAGQRSAPSSMLAEEYLGAVLGQGVDERPADRLGEGIGGVGNLWEGDTFEIMENDDDDGDEDE